VHAQLPRFGIDAYRSLLVALRDAGYAFAPVADLPILGAERAVLLRHDVDLDPPSTLPMAECEAEEGIVATYYVPLTQHFNALAPLHRGAIRRLRELGHEIGLHYDMRTYPLDPAEARAHLEWEIGILEAVSGGPVRTLCMHQPHRGHPDPFRQLPGLVHPHDPALQSGLLYVSDSCRAWRDASLLRALGEGGEEPARLLLNAHPELWLEEAVEEPADYLEQVVLPLGLERARSWFEDEALAWRGHATAQARA
jgi:hypothetical protein